MLRAQFLPKGWYFFTGNGFLTMAALTLGLESRFSIRRLRTRAASPSVQAP
jgi:hypothetical protein